MNYHSIRYRTAQIDEKWLLKCRLTSFTANKLFIRGSCPCARQLNGQCKARLNTRTAPMGHAAEILHPKATPALKSLLIIALSVFISWWEGEGRETAGRSEQAVEKSYEQI